MPTLAIRVIAAANANANARRIVSLDSQTSLTSLNSQASTDSSLSSDDSSIRRGEPSSGPPQISHRDLFEVMQLMHRERAALALAQERPQTPVEERLERKHGQKPDLQEVGLDALIPVAEPLALARNRYLCCALSGQALTDPVVSRSGFTFERKAALAWLEHNDTCPITGEPMKAEELRADRRLRDFLDGTSDESGSALGRCQIMLVDFIEPVLPSDEQPQDRQAVEKAWQEKPRSSFDRSRLDRDLYRHRLLEERFDISRPTGTADHDASVVVLPDLWTRRRFELTPGRVAGLVAAGASTGMWIGGCVGLSLGQISATAGEAALHGAAVGSMLGVLTAAGVSLGVLVLDRVRGNEPVDIEAQPLLADAIPQHYGALAMPIVITSM